MRKLTALFTKSLLLPAALACAFILAGCQGALTDEELKMSLLQEKSGTGLDLLADEDDASNSSSALVGTWLMIEESSHGILVEGFIFYADGTGQEIDESHYTGDIADLVADIKEEYFEFGPDFTWTVSGNILRMTEPDYGDGKRFDSSRRFTVSGSTLQLQRIGGDDPDENVTETYTKYGF